jgi:hypothetical protein
LNNTIKKWHLALGGVGILVIIIMILLTGLFIPAQRTVTNTYIIPAGTLRPFSVATNGSGDPVQPIQCNGMMDRIDGPDDVSGKDISPALDPSCTSCTEALLTRSVGGFNGNRLLVRLYDYTGTGRTFNPDPHGEINYSFYARTMKQGNVRYRISRVAGLYDTVAGAMPENISVSITPDEFSAEPGQEYTSTVTVHVKPATILRENFWIYIHADVEGEPDAVTDDWVRLAIDDGSTMSGMGLYHFYQGTGGYCQNVLVIPQGSSGHIPFFIRTGELDTGNVTVNLTAMPCNPDHGPLRPDELPPWPAGIAGSVTPDRFTGRSFANYLADISFTVDSSVRPGDYCFSAILRTPTGGFDFAPFTVRVVPV